MESDQQKKLNRYLTISFSVHLACFLSFFIGSLFAPKTMQFMPSVQIDMVALPDKVKSEDSPPVDTSLPIKENTPPAEVEAKKPEPEALAEPVAQPKPKAEPEAVDDLALKRKKEKEAEKRAKAALQKMRDQAKKEKLAEAERKREALEKRKADLKRFEQTFRDAVRGNQVNQGTALTGAMQAAMNAYAGHITSRLQSNWTLPPHLQSQGLRAVVRVYIDARGNVFKMQFTHVSGNNFFDNQVEGTIRKSSPFAPPPEEMAPGLRSSGLEVLFPL